MAVKTLSFHLFLLHLLMLELVVQPPLDLVLWLIEQRPPSPIFSSSSSSLFISLFHLLSWALVFPLCGFSTLFFLKNPSTFIKEKKRKVSKELLTMVFSSHVPIYLDPPNLQQQHQQGNGSENPQFSPLPPPPPHVGAGGPASIRPSSMADRARLAKIPQPEAALKCPRCESSNTKFCYFNNYSLSQPRHFCKTCRRYWTRGGALRNVPVGGGCRKNKKNKSSSSEPPAEKQTGNSNSKNSVVIPTEITGHLPFMASLQNFSQYGVGNIGLNFGGIQGETSGASRQADMGFQIGTNSGMSSASILSSSSGGGGTHQHQQFPFFDPSNGLYAFQSEGMEGSSSMVGESQLLRSMSPCSRASHLAPVKMENNHQGLNISRPQLGVSENNQYWGGNSWTNILGLNSSGSTNHLL